MVSGVLLNNVVVGWVPTDCLAVKAGTNNKEYLSTLKNK